MPGMLNSPSQDGMQYGMAAGTEQITVDERIDALQTLQRWVKEKKIDTDKWRRTIEDGRR